MSETYADLIERFAEAVREMRARQRAYFKNRSQANLIASIEQEKRVDGLLEELKQPRLAVPE